MTCFYSFDLFCRFSKVLSTLVIDTLSAHVHKMRRQRDAFSRKKQNKKQSLTASFSTGYPPRLRRFLSYLTPCEARALR